MKVRFNNVNFSYDEDSVVLKNFNLTINDGEMVAILGHNGSGKSTISINYSGLVFMQVDISGYQIFLPTGDLVANVLFPPDYQYCADSIGLGYLCRAIAWRYGIV